MKRLNDSRRTDFRRSATSFRGLRAMWAVMVMLVLLGAQAAFADPPADREARLGELLGTVKGVAPGESARVFLSPEKYARFLGAPSSAHFPTDAGDKAAPAQNAAAFLNKWRELFVDKAAASVRFEQDRAKKQGTLSYVRFRQTVSGLPVFGAAAVVQVNSSGGVACVATDLMRDTQALDSGKVALRPGLNKEKAGE